MDNMGPTEIDVSFEKAGDEVAAEPPGNEKTDHRTECGPGDGIQSPQKRAEDATRENVQRKGRYRRDHGGPHHEDEESRAKWPGKSLNRIVTPALTAYSSTANFDRGVGRSR